MTSKTIRTTNGERLRLTKTRLVQVDHPGADNPWYAKYPDIRRAYRHQHKKIKIYEVGGEGYSIITDFNRPHTVAGEMARIGCCWFDEATFNHIIRGAFGRKLITKKDLAMAAKAGAR